MSVQSWAGPAWQPEVVIGDIEVDRLWVRTPIGVVALRDAAWSVVDDHHSITRTPLVAVIFALVLIPFTFFLSLLLLLIKQDRTWYEAQVTVFGPGFTHVSRIPVKDTTGLAQIHARVGYARSLLAAR